MPPSRVDGTRYAAICAARASPEEREVDPAGLLVRPGILVARDARGGPGRVVRLRVGEGDELKVDTVGQDL